MFYIVQKKTPNYIYPVKFRQQEKFGFNKGLG